MRRRIAIPVLAGAGLAFVILLLLSARPPARPVPEASSQQVIAPAQPLPRPVFIHYYTWYSAPPFTASYDHWDGGNSTRPGLPANIASAAYPLLGPYASMDPAVIAQHMAWIAAAKADVLIYSWWGQGDETDALVPAILDAAAQQGLHVTFQIEPYRGRTINSIISDVAYIYRKYGSSPAFYRETRPTMYGPSTSPRGLFFLYAPPGGGTFDTIRGTPDDAILLARQDDRKVESDAGIRASISGLHLDGVYNYGQYTYAALPPLSADYIGVYSASPGFDNSRSTTGKAVALPREDGAYYDRSWQGLAELKPEGVAVVSFNEWHEGTQIEPAKPLSYDGQPYRNYEGAYGLSGADAYTAYLSRTAYWVSRYKA